MSAEFIQSKPPQVERIVLLENPFAKNGWRGRKQLQDLVEYSELPYDTITTDADPAVTADRLDVLTPTDILYVVGGDGTVNTALEPALRAQALLLPTRSGNANDLAMSLNGKTEPWQVYAGLEAGWSKVFDIHPIAVNIDNGIEHTTRYAANYASFGYAALASQYLNSPWKHPRLKSTLGHLPPRLQNAVRMPREGFLLGKAAADAKTFDASINSTPEATKVADITVVHSERMAKLGRFSIEHTSELVFATVLTKTGPLAMGNQFFKMMRKKMVGEYRDGLTLDIVEGHGATLYYQVDGEAFPLPDNAHVDVKLSEKHLRVLSTKLLIHNA